MAYIPSLNDIPDESKKSGYVPSFQDIPSGRPVSESRQKSNNHLENQFGEFKKGFKKAEEYAPIALGLLGGLPGAALYGGYEAYKANPGEKLEKGLIGAGESLLGGKAIKLGANAIRSLFSKATGQLSHAALGKMAQNAHDLMNKRSEKIFDNVSKEVSSRGINEIPIDKSIIDEARDFMPKTRSSNKLLNKAETGNYNALRKLQSDLGSRGADFRASKLRSEKDTGSEMFDTRDKINESISNHLKNTGNHDLEKELNQARGIHKNMREIYYQHPTLAKLVGSETRKIPKNIANIFNETSKPMEIFRNAHPNIKEALRHNESAKNIVKGLLGSSALGGTVYGLNAINNIARPEVPYIEK